MPNPFPGVNPFIEATGDLWVGFHNLLIGQMTIVLNATLMPRGYAAFVDQRVELVEDEFYDDDVVKRMRRPDVGVARTGDPRRRGSAVGATAVLDVEPTIVENPELDSIPVSYIEIRSLPDQEVITGIELLSPSNKSGSGFNEYALKRAAVLAGGVSLVEIDLLLGGKRPEVIGQIPPGDFCALVSRADRKPRCDAYAWSIRRKLPRLPIPLKPGDEDAVLDLAKAYAMAYDGGPYSLMLPHDRPLKGPVSAEDRDWIAEQVATPR